MSSFIFNLWIIVFVGVICFVRSTNKNYCYIDGKALNRGSKYFTHSCYTCTCLGDNIYDCDGKQCKAKKDHCKVGSKEIQKGKEIVMGCKCFCLLTDRLFCNFTSCPTLIQSERTKIVNYFSENYCVIQGKQYREGSSFFTAACYTCTCLGYDKYECVGSKCPIAAGYCVVKNRFYPVKSKFKLGCNCTCVSSNRFVCDFTPCLMSDNKPTNIFEKKTISPGKFSCVIQNVPLSPGKAKILNLCYRCTCIGKNLILCDGKYCPTRKNICYNREIRIKRGNMIKIDCHCVCIDTNLFYCDTAPCALQPKGYLNLFPSRWYRRGVKMRNCFINQHTLIEGRTYPVNKCYRCTCLGNNIFYCDGKFCQRKENYCSDNRAYAPLGNIARMGCNCMCVDTNKFFCDFYPCFSGKKKF